MNTGAAEEEVELPMKDNQTVEIAHDDVNRITELHVNLQAEEQERIDEEKRIAEEKRLEEERKLEEKKKAEEEKRLAEEKKANEIKKAKLAEEARKQEEARKAEALRLAAEAEEAKLAEEEETASNESLDRGMNGTPTGQTMIMESTAYSSDPADSLGGGTMTATGQNLLENPMAVAVDPNYIPLGTKLYVEGYGTAYAVDTGGAIKGNIIDVHFPTAEECIQWGRRQVKVTILS